MVPSIFLVLSFLLISSAHTLHGDPRCSAPSSRCIHSTKVFIMPIIPKMFNWTIAEGDEEQFSYRPSLLGSPDLPSWIQYTYSKRHHSGFLYGAPPIDETNVTLEIIGLNQRNYNTGRRIERLVILPKEEPAQHQVELKVDNMAVEDIFDSEHLDSLLSIFRNVLWPEAERDLHVTFLASAVQLGARLPLRPEEKEGVVIFLGSASKVSNSLLQLQEEVRPLYRLLKVGSCPRDFKRTTVDRLFRKQNFEMDWCAFRLTGGHEKQEESHPHNHFNLHHDIENSLRALDKTVWNRPFREEIPERSYVHEFLLSILVPMLIMILLVFLLSFILCFHHEGMDDGSSEYFDSIFDVCEDILGNKRNQETPAVQMVRYAAVQRASSTLRSLSTQRDTVPSSSRISSEQDGVLRPQPPPYGIGLRNSGVDF